MEHVNAICCPPPERPGSAMTTTLTGHLSELVGCNQCGLKFTVDFPPSAPTRIANFESRLIVAARKAIAANHGKILHGRIFVDIREV